MTDIDHYAPDLVEIADLRARCERLEGALRLWDKWHVDNGYSPRGAIQPYPPPLNETWSALAGARDE